MAAALHSRHVPNDCSYPEYLEGPTNPPAAQPTTEAEHHSVGWGQLKALFRVENTVGLKPSKDQSLSFLWGNGRRFSRHVVEICKAAM